MSLADGIVLLLVACAAVAVLRFMRSQKKAGKRPAAAEVAPVFWRLLLRQRKCEGGSMMPITLLRPGETGVVKRIGELPIQGGFWPILDLWTEARSGGLRTLRKYDHPY